MYWVVMVLNTQTHPQSNNWGRSAENWWKKSEMIVMCYFKTWTSFLYKEHLLWFMLCYMHTYIKWNTFDISMNHLLDVSEYKLFTVLQWGINMAASILYNFDVQYFLFVCCKVHQRFLTITSWTVLPITLT